MQKSREHIAFKKLSFITLVAVYFLILVGGIVRSTGSGMGCPDWPKCFGNWVPPTDVSELPATYKEDYVAYRQNKNVRFAKYLILFGMSKKAEQITQTESVREESTFNVYKTWTEYVNRLVGATIGLLIFAMMIGSITYFNEDKTVFYLSMFSFFLVGFQGWIGSIVVSTNLMPWMITIHMILALFIVLLLIYINFRIRRASILSVSTKDERILVLLTIICLFTMGVQIILGTQVRETMDIIASDMAFAFRDTWISKAGLSFFIHRSFSLLILGLHVWLLYMVLKNRHQSSLVRNMGKYIVLLIFIEMVSGVIMAYFAIPPFIQPIHLLFSTLIFGVLYYMFLIIRNSKNKFATS